MKEITILEELKNLLPPLTETEFQGLEESILKEGVLSPLIVWNDVLVDGHHRYEICKKHEIPYQVKNIILDSLDAAKLWAWKHQENRRNLTAFHRGELALKLKDVIAARAKERQGNRNDLNDDNIPPKSAECKETRQGDRQEATRREIYKRTESVLMAFLKSESTCELYRDHKEYFSLFGNKPESTSC